MLEQPFDRLLVTGAAVVAAGCAGWLLLAGLAVIVETISDSPDPGRLARSCPAVLRRLLVAACGFVVAGAVTVVPAAADPAGTADPAVTVSVDQVTGLAVPDRPAGVAPGRAEAGRSVRVAPGDSLWRIAERLLAPAPSEVAVAAAVRAIYAANAPRVGPDPDLVFPGTQLEIPDLLSSTERTSHDR